MIYLSFTRQTLCSCLWLYRMPVRSLLEPASFTWSVAMPLGCMLFYSDSGGATRMMVVPIRQRSCYTNGGQAIRTMVTNTDGGCATSMRRTIRLQGVYKLVLVEQTWLVCCQLHSLCKDRERKKFNIFDLVGEGSNV